MYPQLIQNLIHIYIYAYIYIYISNLFIYIPIEVLFFSYIYVYMYIYTYIITCCIHIFMLFLYRRSSEVNRGNSLSASQPVSLQGFPQGVNSYRQGSKPLSGIRSPGPLGGHRYNRL